MKTSVSGPLFNKFAGLQSCNLIKKRLYHKCFPVNMGKFLRTASFIEHLWWLLLTKCLCLQQIFKKLWQNKRNLMCTEIM